MKSIISILISMIFFLSMTTHADNEEELSNAVPIFNWIESEHAQYFYRLSEEPINTSSANWVYRYYPESGNAIGIYNGDVYVIGASWAASLNNPIKVVSVNEVLALIEKDKNKINAVNEGVININSLISYNYLLGNSVDLFKSNSLRRRGENYFSGYELARKYLDMTSSSKAAWEKSVKERSSTNTSTVYGQKLRNAEHYLYTYFQIENFGYTNIIALSVLVDGYCGLSGGYEVFSSLRYYFNSYFKSYNYSLGSKDAAKAGCLGAAHSAIQVYWKNN